MNLKELASPIRLYWDVTPAPGHGTIDYKRISEQIVSNKILSLQISDSGPFLSEACLIILDTLKDKTIALFLTTVRSALIDSSLRLLRNLPLRGIFVATAAEDELESVIVVQDKLAGSIPVGISFSVTRDNYHDLPAVLSFCINNGVAYLVLPMQRVMYERDCFYLTRQEGHVVSAQLQKITIPSHLKLVIHDPFLWRVFYPSVSFPDGGCQAANTMLYISSEADVYPCPTVPIAIGNLTKTSLRDIICSEGKNDVRKKIIAAPGVCRDCGELDQCKGGCRGRAYAIHNSWAVADPACS
jgi:GeoRSP system SPASM domain protein